MTAAVVAVAMVAVAVAVLPAVLLVALVAVAPAAAAAVPELEQLVAVEQIALLVVEFVVERLAVGLVDAQLAELLVLLVDSITAQSVRTHIIFSRIIENISMSIVKFIIYISSVMLHFYLKTL